MGIYGKAENTGEAWRKPGDRKLSPMTMTVTVTVQETKQGERDQRWGTRERLVMGSLIYGLQGQGPLSVEELRGTRRD